MELDESPADQPPVTAPSTASERWLRRGTFGLGELAVEIIAVVVGILLALAIDGWNKDRETAAHIATAKQALHAEIQTNRSEVAKALDDITAKAAEMAKADAPVNAPLQPCNTYPQWHGVAYPLFLDSAYQTSIATQALAQMDFGQAQRIAYVYARQRQFQTYLEMLLNTLVQEHPSSLESCFHVIGVEERDNLRNLDSVYKDYLGHDLVDS